MISYAYWIDNGERVAIDDGGVLRRGGPHCSYCIAITVSPLND